MAVKYYQHAAGRAVRNFLFQTKEVLNKPIKHSGKEACAAMNKLNSSDMSGLFYFCRMSKQFTLGKNERLKSRKQIEKLFAEGKSFVIHPYRVYFIVNSLPMAVGSSIVNSILQFGVGVSSKNFKRSVDRNRIKRLTREAWRMQKNELKELLSSTNKQLNVFFIYTGKELPGFATVKDKVAVVLKKLSDKLNENDPPHS